MGHDRSRERLPFLCRDCTDKAPDDPLCKDCDARVIRRNELAEDNSRLIGYTMKRYFRRNPLARRHYPKDDAYADGFIGLLRAAELYDPSQGTAFSTYASYWIMQSLDRGWDRHWNIIHKPVYLDEIPVQASTFYDFDAIVREVMAKETLSPERKEACDIVRAEIAKMHHRYAYVLLQQLRGKTNTEIGEELGISRERVRQLYLLARLTIDRRLREVFPQCLRP